MGTAIPATLRTPHAQWTAAQKLADSRTLGADRWRAATYCAQREHDMRHVWSVPSRTRPYLHHIVTARLINWRELGDWQCTCEAGARLQPCWHIGAASESDRRHGDAPRSGLVFSLRTLRWLTLDERDEEDRLAFIAYATRRAAMHDEAWWA